MTLESVHDHGRGTRNQAAGMVPKWLPGTCSPHLGEEGRFSVNNEAL